MNDPGIARFKKQLAAETWANELALRSVESVPEEQRMSGAYQRAEQLLPHCQQARGVWLARLKGEPHEMPRDWFPTWHSAEVRRACEDMDRAWAAYLDSLTDADLSREVRYTSSEGKVYSSLVEDILIHVFNHSTYHRGQIARLVTESGGDRAGTDYIVFGRSAR
jgi:uncharacterized damage-inducible protein DinB